MMKSCIALLFVVGSIRATAQHHDHSAHTSITTAPKQTASYAGEEQLPIKAMPDDMIDGYQNGRGMGLAKAAELNHYPGPMHILQLKDKLRLLPDQVTSIQVVFDRMHNQAVHLGKSLIEQEQMLDDTFKATTADSVTVQQLTAHIGELQAKIRFAHLNAHITAQKILTKEQIALYDKERGYVSGASKQQKKK
jgi:Spy/CpxP family protein refolding chaperone